MTNAEGLAMTIKVGDSVIERSPENLRDDVAIFNKNYLIPNLSRIL